jgi:hypothetical protein
VTLTGSSVFTGLGTYTCYGSDTTSSAGVVTFTYVSGTQVEMHGSISGDNVQAVCIGW